jgi:ABC-type transporter Mla MlaB component
MLRISESLSSAGITTLRLEGRLSGPWVEEASRSCEFYSGNIRRLNLDLEELSFVDREGIALLNTLAKRGVGFTNCSQFLKERLKGGV